MSEPGVAPEDIGLKATRQLLAEVNKGGCVDRKHQTLVIMFMVLGSEDVGRCRMGEPTPRTYAHSFQFLGHNNKTTHRIQFLRDVQTFFGTSFKIVEDSSLPGCSQLLYSCYGTGYVNANRTLA